MNKLFVCIMRALSLLFSVFFLRPERCTASWPLLDCQLARLDGDSIDPGSFAQTHGRHSLAQTFYQDGKWKWFSFSFDCPPPFFRILSRPADCALSALSLTGRRIVSQYEVWMTTPANYFSSLPREYSTSRRLRIMHAIDVLPLSLLDELHP